MVDNGQGHGMVRPANNRLCCFFFDAAAADPDHLILECTGGVDIEGYCLINEAAGAAEEKIKKHKIIKINEAAGDKFHIEQAKYCCRVNGESLARLRSYTICSNKRSVVVDIPWSTETVQEFFMRRIVGDARMFFRAPQAYVKRELQGMFDKKTAQGLLDEMDINALWGDGLAKALLTEAEWGRFEDQREEAKHRGLEFAALNVVQNVAFSNLSAHVPALLRGSKLWGVSLKRGRHSLCRPLLAYERIGVMGYPTLLSNSNRGKRHLPGLFRFQPYFHNDPNRLTENELKSLTGNMMHCHQVSLPFIMILFGTHAA